MYLWEPENEESESIRPIPKQHFMSVAISEDTALSWRRQAEEEPDVLLPDRLSFLDHDFDDATAQHEDNFIIHYSKHIFSNYVAIIWQHLVNHSAIFSSIFVNIRRKAFVARSTFVHFHQLFIVQL